MSCGGACHGSAPPASLVVPSLLEPLRYLHQCSVTTRRALPRASREPRPDEGGLHHREAPVPLGRVALLALELKQDDRRQVSRETQRLVCELVLPLVKLIGNWHAALSFPRRRHHRVLRR
jgi:hypothetical protein